jgi:hypothetical protein
MKVRCIRSTGVELPESYLDPAAGFSREAIFPLKAGKDYVVFALTLRRGGVWFYVLDERGADYPAWSPAPLFEVTDPRVSRCWVISEKFDSTRAGDIVLAFPSWASDPLNYYDRLSDGEASAVSEFQRFREFMELEFATPDNSLIATDLGEGWILCTSCFESWRAGLRGELLKCPRCGSILRNPTLLERDSEKS